MGAAKYLRLKIIAGRIAVGQIDRQ